MKRLLVLFFAVLPCFSFAACWQSIYFDDNLKDNVFIDLCGISGKDIKTFWAKYTFSKEKDIERNGKKMNKSMSFHSIDCINSKISTKSINYYLNDEYSHSAKWDMESYENIVPETVGEKIKDSVCDIDSFKEKVDFFSQTKEAPCFSKEEYQTDTKAISYDECIAPKKYMGLIKIITSTRIKADEALKIFGYNVLAEEVILKCFSQNKAYTQLRGLKFKYNNETNSFDFLSYSNPEIEFVYDAGLYDFLSNVFCKKEEQKPIYKNK